MLPLAPEFFLNLRPGKVYSPGNSSRPKQKGLMSATLFLVNCPTFAQAPTFALSQGMAVLGRSSRCDLIVTHESVSRRHAEFDWRGEFPRLKNLSRSNGTYVNEMRVHSCRLAIGDTVQFGAVVYSLATTPQWFDGLDSDKETQAEINIVPPAIPGPVTKVLSPMQSQVLRELLHGHSEKKIAEMLEKSPETIHSHVSAIHRRLGVHSRAELHALIADKLRLR